MGSSAQNIIVSGDLIQDWHLYTGERCLANERQARGSQLISCAGGAALLHKLIQETHKQAGTSFMVHAGWTEESAASLPSSLHAYAVWKPYPHGKEPVWRVSEAHGYGPWSEQEPEIKPFSVDVNGVHTLVLDDAGLRFRVKTCQNLWFLPEKPEATAPQWIVLKHATPVAQGDLWRTLSRDHAERLVVVISAESMRHEGARIRCGLSWESTMEDILRELHRHPQLKLLLKCRHLIISMRADGVLWIDRTGAAEHQRLIFDPGSIEGEWESDIDGGVFGHLTCLTAAISFYLGRDGDRLEKGIQAGIEAIRAVHRLGHGTVGKAEPGFPFERVAKAILKPSEKLFCAPLPDLKDPSACPSRDWMLHATAGAKPGLPLYGVANRIALKDVNAVGNIPCVKFGELVTVDRIEIESLRRTRDLIHNYEKKAEAERPLSLAVFGPPGSGKSFGIKQIAKAVLGDNAAFLEFNLSQLTSPNELNGAFHQVRDEALKGKTPVVFWDEFDTREFFWLQYFLAPMQDGTFLEGQITHPIGKCIFVFAGGTSHDFESFEPAPDDAEGKRGFKLVKGPDFVSRLAGYLNVLGPNPRKIREGMKWKTDPLDLCFPIRRAVLLRAMLNMGDDEELTADPALLTALLQVEKYRHGARSMQGLVGQMATKNRKCLRKSDLPPFEQLNLYVDADGFEEIVETFARFAERAEEIAPKIHEVWAQTAKINPDALKPEQQTWLVPYEQLPDDVEAENVKAALRIPGHLALVGLFIVPKEHPHEEYETDLEKIIEGQIEFLAEEEHNTWMDAKYRDGWRYGDPRDDGKRLHNLMVPFSKLPEEEKQKDRNQIRCFLHAVREAGFRVVTRPRREQGKAILSPEEREGMSRSLLAETARSSSQASASPALRIGVIGHRPDDEKRPAPDIQKLRQTAHAILKHIAEAFNELEAGGTHPSNGKPHSTASHGPGALRVISSLAAGADQWITEEAVSLGYELHCLLPSSRVAYRKDFSANPESESAYDALLQQAAVVWELSGRVGTETEGIPVPDNLSYETAGRSLLDQADLLMAVWDGKDAHGPGGTGQVIHEALLRGIPVVWIWWTDPERWQILESNGHLLLGNEENEPAWMGLTELVRGLLALGNAENSCALAGQ